MKRIGFILLFILASLYTKAQYNPSIHTVTNKAIGFGQATPSDARSMYYDASLFVYRPYANRAEILAYLNLVKYRTGNFPIIMDSASQRWVYWFRNCTHDTCLVLQTVDINSALSNYLLKTLQNGKIWIGNGFNLADPVTPTGDLTISNTGVTTLSNTGVTPGTYTSADIIVDAQGRITLAANGLGGGTVDSLFQGYAINLTPDTIITKGTVALDSAVAALYFLRRKDSTLYTTITRLADTAAAIRANFPSGNVTGTGVANQLTYWDGTSSITGSNGFTVIPAQNEILTDSTSVIQHRADYVTLNAVQVVDTVRTFGNSITDGSNASPTLDSGYVYRLGSYLEKPVGNYAIAGRGSVTAISQHYLYTPLLHNDMSLVMVGFNDIRRNNVQGANGYKTLNKIVNAHKSIFLNHFLKSFVAAGSASVTRYNVGGSWAAPWDARAEGGKTGQGAFTGGLNDSAVYAFTDSTVGVGLIGADTEGSTYSVYIDNVLVFSGTTVGQYDGINDGFPGNTRAPLCVIFTGLTYSAHSIKVVKTSGSSLLILDYFGHLRDAETAPPLVILHAPYMNAAGYATSPNASNVVRTDTMNNKLDSLVASFPSAYQPHVFLIETNNCYDTLTGLDVDNIHPNNTGHRQIFNCITASISADVQPIGSIYFSNDAFYGINSTGPNKFIIGTGTENYIPKFTAANILGNSLIQDDGTNIGISQTPATYKLGVTGTARITGSTYLATASGSDRVGIGTTSPNFKLEVNGGTNIIGTVSTSGPSSGISIGTRISGDGFSMYSGTGELKWFSLTENADKMTLTSSGSLGIGTTSPSRLLHSDVADASTNTIAYPFMISHQTSGAVVPVAGFGSGIEFRNESGGGNQRVSASLTNPYTDVTNAAENADLEINLIRAGTLTKSLNLRSTGELNIGDYTDQGSFTLQNTGGFRQNGTVQFHAVPVGTTSMNILLQGNTDSTLYKIPASTFLSGSGIYGGSGSLPSNVTVTSAVAGRNLNITGISAFIDGPLLNVNTTGSVGIAIQGESTDGRGVQGVATSGNALYGSATSGYGLFSQATTGSGIYSQTNSGLILEGLLSSTGTNDVLSAESLTRSTSGTAAAGFGFSQAMYLQASTGTSRLSNEIITEWTDATDGTRTSQLRITGVNSATTGNKAIFKGSGQFQLPAYGFGTFTGTATTSANFDASGNLIEGPVTTNSQTYVPTLTGVANVTGTTASTVYYRQSGDIVDVWGIVGIDPTAALTLTRLGFSLPVASTFSGSGILAGSGQSDTIAQGIAFKADTSNNRAEISFMATDDTNVSYFFKFTYKVTPP